MSAQPNMPQPGPASDRLVIRPETWVFMTVIPALGITGMLCAGLALIILLKGQPAGLIFLLVSAISFFGIYVTVGGYLWADSTQFGSTRPFERTTGRREDLASMHLGRPVGRSGVPCSFVRKDGSVAFSTPVSVWGNAQIHGLAGFLNVPLVNDTLPLRYVCPVCGYPGLEEPASSKGEGSYEICPSCGFEFSDPVDQQRYDEWRGQWVSGGMVWWAAQAGRSAPDGWDPTTQLKGVMS